MNNVYNTDRPNEYYWQLNDNIYSVVLNNKTGYVGLTGPIYSHIRGDLIGTNGRISSKEGRLTFSFHRLDKRIYLDANNPKPGVYRSLISSPREFIVIDKDINVVHAIENSKDVDVYCEPQNLKGALVAIDCSINKTIHSLVFQYSRLILMDEVYRARILEQK